MTQILIGILVGWASLILAAVLAEWWTWSRPHRFRKPMRSRDYDPWRLDQ